MAASTDEAIAQSADVKAIGDKKLALGVSTTLTILTGIATLGSDLLKPIGGYAAKICGISFAVGLGSFLLSRKVDNRFTNAVWQISFVACCVSAVVLYMESQLPPAERHRGYFAATFPETVGAVQTQVLPLSDATRSDYTREDELRSSDPYVRETALETDLKARLGQSITITVPPDAPDNALARALTGTPIRVTYVSVDSRSFDGQFGWNLPATGNVSLSGFTANGTLVVSGQPAQVQISAQPDKNGELSGFATSGNLKTPVVVQLI